MKNKTLRTNAMKLKKVIAASLAISVLFCICRLRKFFLNRQNKHKTGIFFHNRNGQRRRAERKTE